MIISKKNINVHLNYWLQIKTLLPETTYIGTV